MHAQSVVTSVFTCNFVSISHQYGFCEKGLFASLLDLDSAFALWTCLDWLLVLTLACLTNFWVCLRIINHWTELALPAESACGPNTTSSVSGTLNVSPNSVITSKHNFKPNVNITKISHSDESGKRWICIHILYFLLYSVRQFESKCETITEKYCVLNVNIKILKYL